MADEGFRVVLVVPACGEWPFQAQWRTTSVGKLVKKALRVADGQSRGAGLDVVFYGWNGARDEVVVSTRLEPDRQEEWLRDWTYLPDDSVSLSKGPRRGARLAEHFGAGLERQSARPLPATREVFERTAERPGHTLVLFWLTNEPEDAFNDAVFFLRHHPTPGVFWQFFSVVQEDRIDRYWKRNGRHLGEDLPNMRFGATWQPRAVVREFRRWQRQLDGPRV